MSIGLNIVFAEHQRLSAVLDCLSNIIEGGPQHLNDAVLDTVDALLSYVDEFIYKHHHPKEDQYIFPAIAKRCPDTYADITALEQQHASGAEEIKRIRELILTSRDNLASEGEELLRQLKVYVAFEANHMVFENTKVFPSAMEHLLPEDWEVIDAAFTDHDDPVFGDKSNDELRLRFSDIVAHAPAPYGLADPIPSESETESHGVWGKMKQMLGL